MALLDRLHKYTANEQRSPTEDFLSEIFLEWLRLAGNAGLMSYVLSDLLRLPNNRCLPESHDGRSIRWSSQHVIGPGFRGTGKRPDIVGQMDDFFLIIENKIGACFTQYEDTAGTTTQIELYDDYQKRQGTSYGGIVLLTHYTYPPTDWKNPVVTWSAVHQWLYQKFPVILKEHKGSTSVLKYWTKNLIDFLEDNMMIGTRIELSDIIALPAYERLRQGMKQLGSLADHELNNKFGKSWRFQRTEVLWHHNDL